MPSFQWTCKIKINIDIKPRKCIEPSFSHPTPLEPNSTRKSKWQIMNLNSDQANY